MKLVNKEPLDKTKCKHDWTGPMVCYDVCGKVYGVTCRKCGEDWRNHLKAKPPEFIVRRKQALGSGEYQRNG